MTEQRLETLRTQLSEHYAHGLVIVSWEEGDRTFHAHAHWGNQYAAQQLATRAEEIVFGDDAEEEEKA